MTHPVVVVGTPCFGGMVTQGYMLSVIRLLTEAPALGVEFGLTMLANDALITRARSTIVSAFLDNPEATHLLFVDADITFAPDQVARLLAADREVAAALYPVKAINWQGVGEHQAQAQTQIQARSSGQSLEEAGFVYVGEFCTGAELKVERGFATANYAGTGFLLIKRQALEKMIAAYPETKFASTHNFPALGAASDNLYALFDCMIDPKSGHYLSEDYSFCRRWRRLGGEIWLDLTSKLSHVGSYSFNGNTAARYAFLKPDALAALAQPADSR